jgi:hypothetical protein
MTSVQPHSDSPLEASSEMDYRPPVEQLLTYEHQESDSDYLELGFTKKDIPELIRLATDMTLFYGDNALASWGPVHAWRVLGQLQAEEAIDPLLNLIKNTEDDWISEELPLMYGLIGPAAIPALGALLVDPGKEAWRKAFSLRALEQIAEKHPAQQDVCIRTVTDVLRRFRENELDMNGFLVASLMNFKAVEEAPLVQEAYEAGYVNERICGTWKEVGINMGSIVLSEEERQQWELEKTQRCQL